MPQPEDRFPMNFCFPRLVYLYRSSSLLSIYVTTCCSTQKSQASCLACFAPFLFCNWDYFVFQGEWLFGDFILRLLFLVQTGVGVLGVALVLTVGASMCYTSHAPRPAHLIFTDMAVGNFLVILFKGIPDSTFWEIMDVELPYIFTKWVRASIYHLPLD